MDQFWHKLESTLGTLKFAVSLILIFSLCMIIGTFLESYYGTDFAARALYKSWGFMLIQGLMYLSIMIATLMRLPPKKRLYGFYVIHTGLLTIGAGSFITFYAGVDGQITLNPLTPTREIVLSRDVLSITRPQLDQKITYFLPPNAFEKNLNDEVAGIKIKEYLPFAENQTEWANSSPLNSNPDLLNSAEYELWNDNVSESFILSTQTEAQDFSSTLNMGPLTVHYLPRALSHCFAPLYAQKNTSGIIIWNAKDGECFIPEDRKIEIRTTKSGSRFLAFKLHPKETTSNEQGKKIDILTFFPDISPWPLTIENEQFNTLQNFPYRIFSKKIFSGSPQLLLFGDKLTYQSNNEWPIIDLNAGPVDLPWMGFKIKMKKFSTEQIPVKIPRYTTPIQKNGMLIKGTTRAIKVNVAGKDYWVTNQGVLRAQTQDEEISFELKKETLNLPFELILNQFKMDKDPGTNNPASFESFVKLFDGGQGPSQEHHIYMNNPLKYQGMTFYQASYFQTDDGGYGSVLSANIDQGRPFKYAGSILLVAGAIWHYFLNRKKKKVVI